MCVCACVWSVRMRLPPLDAAVVAAAAVSTASFNQLIQNCSLRYDTAAAAGWTTRSSGCDTSLYRFIRSADSELFTTVL